MYLLLSKGNSYTPRRSGERETRVCSDVKLRGLNLKREKKGKKVGLMDTTVPWQLDEKELAESKNFSLTREDDGCHPEAL